MNIVLLVFFHINWNFYFSWGEKSVQKQPNIGPAITRQSFNYKLVVHTIIKCNLIAVTHWMRANEMHRNEKELNTHNFPFKFSQDEEWKWISFSSKVSFDRWISSLRLHQIPIWKTFYLFFRLKNQIQNKNSANCLNALKALLS